MKKTILCFNLGEIFKLKKMDNASIGAILTPRLFGVYINEYAQNGATFVNNNTAHVIALGNPSINTVDDLQFEIMERLLSDESTWPQIIVIAPEKTNQKLKSIFPPGDVAIFSPSSKEALSLYDIYIHDNKTYAGLISDRHLYA